MVKKYNIKFGYTFEIVPNVKELKIKNPYFRAFAFEKNLKDDEEYERDEYIPWINDRWMEWCKATGNNYYEPKKEKEHALFKEWLFNAVGLNN